MHQKRSLKHKVRKLHAAHKLFSIKRHRTIFATNILFKFRYLSLYFNYVFSQEKGRMYFDISVDFTSMF